ncbi:phage holin family protein [Lawsonibacter sp. NSJ-52]|uniref:Phage holin family protein n=2 Tax=Lawsonibacter faecis TaxID=2763052 RepID=A0A8J6JH80_9FIRM|nr:phage holin family protein [Lawsonibacter faecis]MBC5736058.1 phage holin family protein [Lawsonibacter faecis]
MVLVTLAAIGSVLANLFGGWDVTLQVLIGCMAVDYATGWVVAAVFKKSPKSEGGALESRAGFKGLVRKVGILALVLVAVWLDKLLGAAYVRVAVCLFFIANEGLSILENLGLMGVPLPPFLKNMLEAMKEKSGNGKAEGKT